MSAALAILNDKNKYYCIVQSSIVFASILGCFLAVRSGFGLTAIAYISTASFALFSFALLRYPIKFFKINLRKSLALYANTYSPFIISTVLYISLVSIKMDLSNPLNIMP